MAKAGKKKSRARKKKSGPGLNIWDMDSYMGAGHAASYNKPKAAPHPWDLTGYKHTPLVPKKKRGGRRKGAKGLVRAKAIYVKA